jgi:translation elongation factor EF-Ts
MNGTIVSYMHHDRRGGAMVEILTETDFAANSEIVHNFGKWLAMIVYGFNFSSWEYLLHEEKKKMNLGAAVKLDELRKEVKEEVKVGRFTILKIGA